MLYVREPTAHPLRTWSKAVGLADGPLFCLIPKEPRGKGVRQTAAWSLTNRKVHPVRFSGRELMERARKERLNLTILYDEPQEAEWFRRLHTSLVDAREESITNAQNWPEVQNVLAYDRPDIVLLDGGTPILVVEQTVEVPSGHNVGQRFARIAAAAESGVPCLYFGPYAAKKHGGKTAGPRYMNTRLFGALDVMERATGTAVTTINWPVDEQYEVRRDPAKDEDVRAYVSTFLSLYTNRPDLGHLNGALLRSDIHRRMIAERNIFTQTEIRNPDQYDGPPGSVEFMTLLEFRQRHGQINSTLQKFSDLVVYKIGMTSIRSDPYTGMSMLYRYLYVSEAPSCALILWFPKITETMWRKAAANRKRKDVRLFRIAADAILFADELLSHDHL